MFNALLNPRVSDVSEDEESDSIKRIDGHYGPLMEPSTTKKGATKGVRGSAKGLSVRDPKGSSEENEPSATNKDATKGVKSGVKGLSVKDPKGSGKENKSSITNKDATKGTKDSAKGLSVRDPKGSGEENEPSTANKDATKGVKSGVKGLFVRYPNKNESPKPLRDVGKATSSSSAPKPKTITAEEKPESSKMENQRKMLMKAEVSRILKCRPTQYYKILRLDKVTKEWGNMEEDKQEKTLRGIYRRSAPLVHPDRWNSRNASAEEVKQATKAFQRLGDAMEKLTANSGFSITAWGGSDDDSDGESEAARSEEDEVYKKIPTGKDNNGKQQYRYEHRLPTRVLKIWEDEATPHIQLLMQDEDDKKARDAIAKINKLIQSGNKKEGIVEKDKWNVPVDEFLDYCREILPFFDLLEFDPNDEDARERLLEVNKKHHERAAEKEWPERWVLPPPSKQQSKGKQTKSSDVNMPDVTDEAPSTLDDADEDVHMSDVTDEDARNKVRSPKNPTGNSNRASNEKRVVAGRRRLRVGAPPIENGQAQFLKPNVTEGIIEEVHGGKVIEKRITKWRKVGIGFQYMVKYTLKSVDYPCFDLIAGAKYKGAFTAYKKSENAVELKTKPQSFLARLNWGDCSIGGVATTRRNPDQDIFTRDAQTFILISWSTETFWALLSAAAKTWGEGQMEQVISEYRYLSGQVAPTKKIPLGDLITAYRVVNGYPGRLRPRIGGRITKAITMGGNEEGPGDLIGDSDADEEDEDDEDNEDVDEYGNIRGLIKDPELDSEAEEEELLRSIKLSRQKRQARKAKEAKYQKVPYRKTARAI